VPTLPAQTIGSFNFCSFHILPDDYYEYSTDTLLTSNINSTIPGNEWLTVALPVAPTTLVMPTPTSHVTDTTQWEVDTLTFTSGTPYTLTVDDVVASNINAGNVNGVSLSATNIAGISLSATNITNSAIISTNNIDITGNLTLNGSSGAHGQVLTTNGSNLYWSNMDPSILTSTVNTWTAGQRGAYVTNNVLSGNIQIDMNAGNNFSTQLNSNARLVDPTNPAAGQGGIIVIQNGVSPYTLSFDSFWKFAGGIIPTITARANAIDVIDYMVGPGGTYAICQIIQDVKS
jgi:hypothetical protein